MATPPLPADSLFPVLRPQTWTSGAVALRTKLIRTEEDLPHNLWVSFAYSTEDKLYTVTKDSLKAHQQKGEDIVLKALENLNTLSFEWQITSRRADGSAAVLTCIHEFAAESILLPEHLVEAQSILGVHEIALALPVAGCLIAQTAHPSHRNELDQLMTWAHENFNHAEGRTLTPNLLTAQMGQIRSMYCNPLTDQKLKQETPSLLPIDFNEEEGLLTFKAEDSELSIWEIERLRTLLKTNLMADGRTVSAVRVVAKSSDAAHEIAQHLQHLPIEVCFLLGEEEVPFSN